MKYLLCLLAVSLILGTATCEKDYTDFVKNIESSIQNSSSVFYHSAYERLAYISDTYGPRMWGSKAL